MATLEQIKALLVNLTEQVEKLSSQQPPTSTLVIPAAHIELRPGEHYAGLITGKDSYHLILMAEQPTDDLNWQAANDWAKRIGGDLPTRRELSLLYANCKEQFEARYHWSSEAYEGDSSYAWSQGFGRGLQDDSHISNELRARAVRRVPL